MKQIVIKELVEIDITKPPQIQIDWSGWTNQQGQVDLWQVLCAMQGAMSAVIQTIEQQRQSAIAQAELQKTVIQQGMSIRQ